MLEYKCSDDKIVYIYIDMIIWEKKEEVIRDDILFPRTGLSFLPLSLSLSQINNLKSSVNRCVCGGGAVRRYGWFHSR